MNSLLDWKSLSKKPESVPLRLTIKETSQRLDNLYIGSFKKDFAVNGLDTTKQTFFIFFVECK